MTARPDRVPAEEVRQRMLDAGRELALEAGAALTIEHLRLEEVIQRARVPRSSAYRLWAYREDYIDDLLCYLAGTGSWFSDRPVLDPETFADIKRILDENRHLLATPEGRRALLVRDHPGHGHPQLRGADRVHCRGACTWHSSRRSAPPAAARRAGGSPPRSRTRSGGRGR